MFTTVFLFPEVLVPFYFKAASSVLSFSCSLMVFSSPSLSVSRWNRRVLASVSDHSSIWVFAVLIFNLILFVFVPAYGGLFPPGLSGFFLLTSCSGNCTSSRVKMQWCHVQRPCPSCMRPWHPRSVRGCPRLWAGERQVKKLKSHFEKNKTKQNPEPWINSLMSFLIMLGFLNLLP